MLELFLISTMVATVFGMYASRCVGSDELNVLPASWILWMEGKLNYVLSWFTLSEHNLSPKFFDRLAFTLAMHVPLLFSLKDAVDVALVVVTIPTLFLAVSTGKGTYQRLQKMDLGEELGVDNERVAPIVQAITRNKVGVGTFWYRMAGMLVTGGMYGLPFSLVLLISGLFVKALLMVMVLAVFHVIIYLLANTIDDKRFDNMHPWLVSSLSLAEWLRGLMVVIMAAILTLTV